MNIAQRDKIVLLGFMSHYPVAGVVWQTLHYLVGFQKLGYDVYYVEAHGCTPSKLMQSRTDDGVARAASYLSRIMEQFGLEHRWAYHAIYESRFFGLSEAQLKELYRSAALIINLHGSHLPNPELTATGRLVYLETDPVEVEIDLFNGRKETLDYLAPHCAFFTYGENLGQPDCRVPAPQAFKFLPTRQPVVMEFWEETDGSDTSLFTTIGNWKQPWREVTFQGEVYRWSKHYEFQKFIDLPSRVSQPFELVLSRYKEEDRRWLVRKGWQVRDALDLSQNPELYRRYIIASRGEFTVAKDQNVRLRSGWFSDRAVTYLAAGRPVITQETGFTSLLPAGQGLMAFSTLDEIVEAVTAINSDYGRHRRAAREIAREYFSYDRVLTRLLNDLGMARARPISSPKPAPAVLPPELDLVPISRWPTRLKEATVKTALALPTPQVAPIHLSSACRVSLIIVTRNGLPYTRMCMASLLAGAWPAGDELILVDNGSSDGTLDFLRELARLNPSIHVIANEQNRGFAAANNQGLAQAAGDILILLNNDTIVLPGWRDVLARWLGDPAIGLVGPVTNRTCNEAQIDAPYRTFAELGQFARDYTHQHRGEGNDIPMLAMFCGALRREVFHQVGPLDERFEVGMFEDDDYSRRIRQAGYRIVCAEDVFVHHFGQAAMGELCLTGEYDHLLESNRRRFEEKWGQAWQPHGRRISPEYQNLRRRIQETVAQRLPTGSTVVVLSKGDEDLLKLKGRCGWHFPQADDGRPSSIYPEYSSEAIAQLEALRAKGGGYLLIPKPGFWWLEHYGEFKQHLVRHYRLAVRDEETCLIFDLGECHD